MGAKAELFHLLRGLADQGIALMVVSEEMEELISLADRIIVLCAGRVSAEFEGNQVSMDRVLRASFPSNEPAG